MKNKETGEFELVVGDKQLLSAFFIGVVLLAVMFAMGYVVGNNNPKSAKVAPDSAAAAASAATGDARPQPASPGPAPAADTQTTPSDSTVAQPEQTSETAQPPAAAPVEAPPQPTTVPAQDASAPAPAKAAPPRVAKPVLPPAVKAAAPAAVRSVVAAPVPDPPAGTYWQVTATTSRNSADAMYQSLKGHGFPALTRPGPNNLTVVWVGPYTDREALARAKKQLEDAGFNKIIKRP
jgi:cell division septation protein DedD